MGFDEKRLDVCDKSLNWKVFEISGWMPMEMYLTWSLDDVG